jgi:hypothetical protein
MICTTTSRAIVLRLGPEECAVPIPSDYGRLGEFARGLRRPPGALVAFPDPDSERHERLSLGGPPTRGPPSHLDSGGLVIALKTDNGNMVRRSGPDSRSSSAIATLRHFQASGVGLDDVADMFAVVAGRARVYRAPPMAAAKGLG